MKRVKTERDGTVHFSYVQNRKYQYMQEDVIWLLENSKEHGIEDLEEDIEHWDKNVDALIACSTMHNFPMIK